MEPDIIELVNHLRKYNVIFSGSYVLQFYKLLPATREINDIDLVFKSEEEFQAFVAMSSARILPLNAETYADCFWQVTIPAYESITIDCFVNPAVEAITAVASLTELGFKMQNPRQILQQKLGILYDRVGKKDSTYAKHLADFNHIFKPAE